jgi:hypothetical protein
VDRQVAVGRSLNMENAFFKYGFRLQKNLTKDLYCAPVVLASGTDRQAQYLPYPWPYYPLAKPKQEELFGSNAGNVFVPFPSTIDTLKNQLDKTILISSSDFFTNATNPCGYCIKRSLGKTKSRLVRSKITSSRGFDRRGIHFSI